MARVIIPLAQGCEELEAVTVIDLLRRASIEVVTAGLDDKPVKASRGTVLIPDTSIDKIQSDQFDMIVLPGGLPGADHLNDSEFVHELIQQIHSTDGWVAAICAAPKVLANAGLLEGKAFTCYPESCDEYPVGAEAQSDKVVLVDGRIVTSRGPGTAMDFALTLIELLAGKETRDNVEKPLVRP